MDIRSYFQKIRAIEESIPERFAVISSLATPDGGVEGRLTEVPRSVAAQMTVDGKARLATAEETQQYRDQMDRARAEAEEASLANRLHVTVLTEQESRNLRGRQKS